MARVVLTLEQQDHVWAQWRCGRSVHSIAREVGTDPQRLGRYFAATGGVRALPAGRSGRQLSVSEREEISRGLAAGHSLRRIAATLGRPPSTIFREVARNGGREDYRAHDADTAAYARPRRPKLSKLAVSPALRQAVEQGLSLEWSPEQISHRLRLDHPDDVSMRVGYQAIYLSLFVPHRAALSRRLTGRLRTGRAMRYPKVARSPAGPAAAVSFGAWSRCTSVPPRPTTGPCPGTGKATWSWAGARLPSRPSSNAPPGTSSSSPSQAGSKQRRSLRRYGMRCAVFRRPCAGR
jgi:hypothetical protein